MTILECDIAGDSNFGINWSNLLGTDEADVTDEAGVTRLLGAGRGGAVTDDERAIARADFRSDRSPYPVVPEPPAVGGRVPHQLSAGRPRRWRWLRCRPRRRGTPGPPARRTERASRALPLVALVPVPIRYGAPARVPGITWAPAIARGRGRSPLGPGCGAAGQCKSGQRHPAGHQHVRKPPHPRSRLPRRRHLQRISFRKTSSKWAFHFTSCRRSFVDASAVRRAPGSSPLPLSAGGPPGAKVRVTRAVNAQSTH